jgi:phosphopantothenoylcysteine decarboxylase/phosphopantothenate--cysteine ligase
MRTVVVTAGPTREKIDPVRFISNYSTGRFGYEIARQARSMGCRVILISGPTGLKPPSGVKVINVESTAEMKKAAEKASAGAGYIIMAAAVSDWRLRSPSAGKIKRGSGRIRLELVENPDIVAGLRKKLGKGTCIVGFALETGSVEKNAAEKLARKGLDIVVANGMGARSSPFGDNNTNILIMDRLGKRTEVRGKTKRQAAKIILDKAFDFNI